jgi:DNA-binding beta-propeller fold protein YncE
VPATAGAWTDSCCLPWDQPAQLAISPDGRFAYASDYTNAFAFARNPDTGDLSAIDSYRATGGGTTELSPDGRTLYVASTVFATIMQFSRNTATGALTPIGEYDSGKPRNAAREFQDIEFTHDGLSAYASDGGLIELVARDPDTGVLTRRSELRTGDPAAPGLKHPSAIELSADERFLYVLQGFDDPLLVLARGNDGGLTQVQQLPNDPYATDLALSPDGHRLYAGPIGPVTFDRNPTTGQLTLLSAMEISGDAGDYPLPDARILPTPDGAALYTLDTRNHHMYQFATTASGLRFVKTYRENADGQGIRSPRALSMSPDGAYVYLGSGPRATFSPSGRIASFRRNRTTNALSFTSLWQGPVFDGHAPWESPAAKVTINDGAEYTNDPDVTLTIEGVSWPSNFYVQISNDGGFTEGASEWVPVPQQGGNGYEWTLATSGPERLPKTVYVRARSRGADQLIRDDIVLDQRPPELTTVTQIGNLLRVAARDRLSGLRWMQVTRNRRKPGAWRKYRARSSYRSGRARTYVRVRDRAGNRSRWVAARKRR